MAKKHAFGKERFELMDWILIIILTLGMLAILIPFFNVVAISFTSYKEYMQSTWVVWPKEPTLAAYKELFKDARILVGYKTTLCYLLFGLPLNLFLCTTLGLRPLPQRLDGTPPDLYADPLYDDLQRRYRSDVSGHEESASEQHHLGDHLRTGHEHLQHDPDLQLLLLAARSADGIGKP